MSTEIDPIEYGKLMAKVDTLELTVEKMSADIKLLLELANRSKGGFWAGMAIASVLGGAASWVATHMQFITK